MTRLRHVALAAGGMFLLTGCAGQAAQGEQGGPAPALSEKPAAALVLRIAYEGGFAPAELIPGRIPAISVYDDGRILTEGGQIAIYPGPALPPLQVQQVGRDVVDGLVREASAAGVRTGADFGQPGVADAPSTRVTVVTGGGTQSASASALNEARDDDPRLTDDQKKARAKLAAYVERVSGLATAKDVPAPEPYVASAVAALARPYTAPEDGLPSRPPAVAWPGPALPGEPLNDGPEPGCVTVTGAQAKQVLAAGKDAKSITEWTSGGRSWSVVLRPLLPDETGCADLRSAR